jgi:hypothetical protein
MPLESGEPPLPPFSLCLNAHRSTLDSTISPAFKDYLDLITPDLPTGLYQFDWWADFKCKGPTNNDIEIRLILDEGTGGEQILFVENGQSLESQKVFCQFIAINLLTGIHSIKMQFRLFNGTGPVSMLAANMSLNNIHSIG